MPEMSGHRAGWMRAVAEDSRHNHSSVSKRLKCQDHSPGYNNATKVPGPLKPRQPLAWQKQAQLQPWSTAIVPLGPNLLDIQATIWLSSEKSLHPIWGAVIIQIQQMETKRWVITVNPSPSSRLCRCFMLLPMLHASADASQHPTITSYPHHHHHTSHTPKGSAQICEFKQSYFPRQVAGKWHYLQKILDHEKKDMMMREYSKTPRKFQKGRHGPSKGNMAMRMEQSPPTPRPDEASPLTDSTSPKEEEIWFIAVGLTWHLERRVEAGTEKVKEESLRSTWELDAFHTRVLNVKASPPGGDWWRCPQKR